MINNMLTNLRSRRQTVYYGGRLPTVYSCLLVDTLLIDVQIDYCIFHVKYVEVILVACEISNLVSTYSFDFALAS